MGDTDRLALTVPELLGVLADGGPDEQLLAALSDGAEALISLDLVHRLVPHAARLRTLDYAAHPWAGLVGGVAIVAVDRAAGRRVLSAAREHFESIDDNQGAGWACFLEGLEDLGEGHLERAEIWWERARRLLGDTGPVAQFSALHQSLAAYARGDLRHASSIAEQALHQARRHRDARTELIAAVYLALYRWWMGDFSGVEQAASSAVGAVERITNPLDRYEEPLLHGVLGAVAYARDQVADGEAHLDRGLAKAAELHNEWYAAILLTIRAELTARQYPLRSVTDARAALDYYERVGEEWWSHWALEAYVVAQRSNGDLHASLVAGEQLMAQVDNPLERGRSMLELAATHVGLGNLEQAADLLDASMALLDKAGARYLVARAELALARCRGRRAEYLVRSAGRRAGPNANDPAWRQLLRGAPIRIQILGQPHVFVDDHPVTFSTRREMDALAMLAIAGASGVHIERLCDALWPNSDRERSVHRLDVLLSSLRKTLSPATRLSRASNVVRIDLDDAECDFTMAVAAGRSALAGSREHVDIALDLLRRPILGGAAVDWVVDAQQQLDALRARLERGSSSVNRAEV